MKMEPHVITADTDDIPEYGAEMTIARVVPVTSEWCIDKIINADPSSDDGRSPWVWIRLASGDLILGVFPRGETYFDTEAAGERP